MFKNEHMFITSLPTEFHPRQEWPEYAAHRDLPSFFRPTVVGTHPRGMRRGVWPLIIEEYVSNTEPIDFTSDSNAPNRIIAWRRVTRKDTPPGWHALSKKPSALEGFFDLFQFPDYAAQWIKVARYDRHQWHSNYSTRYTIEKITWSEYAHTFKHSTVGKKLGLLMVRLMERKWKSDPEHIIFWGAREKSTGEVVACIGVINSPNYQASYYATGCMHSTQASTPVMVGLIDHWFKTSQSHQIRFLHFGSFWIPGEPKAWKGFSTFKMKFKPQLILYPPTLVRLKCGTFF